MRADVLAVLGQYKKEILTFEEVDDDTFGFVIQDWWHYLDDVAINAHDYAETGNIMVNGYKYDKDGWTDFSNIVFTYNFTVEEFNKL